MDRLKSCRRCSRESDSDTSSECQCGEAWLVTPPQSFTASGTQQLPASPMEDLLIEHPSMSVYAPRRTGSTGSSENSSLETSPERSQNHCTPRRSTRVRGFVFRCGHPSKKSASRQNSRPSRTTKNSCTRANLVHHIKPKAMRPRRQSVFQPTARCFSKRC